MVEKLSRAATVLLLILMGVLLWLVRIPPCENGKDPVYYTEKYGKSGCLVGRTRMVYDFHSDHDSTAKK